MQYTIETIHDVDEDAYFLIREHATRGISKQAAWDAARSQNLVVIVQLIDGSGIDLGHVFNPREFERAAYAGYVSHGVSMTDGTFYPLKFDQWVTHFRKSILAGEDPHSVWYNNDAPVYVQNALGAYAMELQRVSA